MADLTAIILTKNEELNIAKCINSIKPVAKRIIVVDSGSTDRTVEIAKELGAEVVVHVMDNFIHAKQFLYALENTSISTNWVLRIDADEELTTESASELNEKCNANDNTDINGIIVRFKVSFMGKELKHGGIYPFKKLLAFKYGKGTIEDRHMDEHIILTEGKSIELENDSLHHDYKDLTYWINKHNAYATLEALDYFNNVCNKEKANSEAQKLDGTARVKRYIKYNIYYKLPSSFRCKMYYFYRCILRGAFLDGREGRIFAFLQAYWYRYLVDAKICEMDKNRE